MQQKPNVTIRMGANKWEVEVRGHGKFNLNKMPPAQQKHFIREFVIAFREARCA